MAEPFVFHFRPDPRGFPQQMTVADVRGVCGLCQHDEIQRFYRAIPFHSATVDTVLETARGVRDWTEYECANCGTAVGPEQVVATAFVWPFVDDAGLIRVFESDDDGERVQLVPGRRLDPQELPGFAPDDDGAVVDELDEEAVEARLGRPFSIKLAVRDLLVDVWQDPEGGGWSPLGNAAWVVVATDEIDAVYDEIDDPRWSGAETLVEVDLANAVPHGLPAFDDPVAMPGRLETWLGAELAAHLEDGRISARILVDRQVIAEMFRRSFDVARLEFECLDDRITDLRTPTDRPYPHDIPFDAVARRAAYTGITPGEAARITAEEVVARLLNVFGR